MENKETKPPARVTAVIRGALVSVIDATVGQPVGEAVLASARVTFRPRAQRGLQPAPKPAKA